jgi:hypothetical protein
MGGTCTPPPAPAPNCDSASTQFGNFTGCCVNNNCGVDFSQFGFGCVDSTNPMAARFLMGVTPKTCDGKPIPQGSGGGSGAGGGTAAGGGPAGGASGAGGGSAGGGGTAGGGGSAAGGHAGAGGGG